MKLYLQPNRKDWEAIIARPVLDNSNLMPLVKNILEEVKDKGDEAIRKYTLEFDKVNLEIIQVSHAQLLEAELSISNALKRAIQNAQSNIEKFHLKQMQPIEKIETMQGVWCWRKSVGIQSVGIYIPGGTAPLFSTVLMLGVPAMLAECKEIILCTPPNAAGKIDPAILYAAKLVGIHKIYAVGGVQAIAAMAFGTATIPKVCKIFGPGNQYVTAAKQCIQQYGIAIDMPAGPSEVCIWADENAIPAFVAADLLSQAEHGVDSQVVLISSNEKLVNDVQVAINKQLVNLSRSGLATKALENAIAIVLEKQTDAIDLINQYAPEHLILALENAANYVDSIVNAGSVFIGNFSPEAAGDYASGTNHVLPTNGHANAYSGVSLDSFVKKITFQQLTENGLTNIAQTVIEMAAAEQLDAHANAVKIRMDYLEQYK